MVTALLFFAAVISCTSITLSLAFTETAQRAQIA